MKNAILPVLIFFLSITLQAQTPTEQDCLGAIPVCEGFYQQINSYTGTGNYPNEIPTTGGCPGNCMLSGEKNCVWYYVTVQSDGDMGFLITPNNGGDDYDWVVYDITDARCEDIYSMAAQLQVSCNWSGTAGPTGPNGNSGNSCQGASGTPYNAMIPVVDGQNFVINISNYSSTQYGYALDFSMSTAQIFDDEAPEIEEIFSDEVSGCSTTELRFTFDEKVLCERVLPSAFGITGPGGPYYVTDVYGVTCDVGGAWEKEFTLTVDPPFASNGDYMFHMTTAFPGIVDACNNAAQGADIPFTLDLGAPTLNSTGVDITPATCGMSNGSITGLTANGQTALSYIWKNSHGTVVGNSIDLIDVPAELYTLEVHDLQFCVATGGPWEVEEFGAPEIDDENVSITSSNYGASNGAISGIVVNSSFNIEAYTWTNENDDIVGNDLDLSGVPSGYYELEVLDENTCPAVAGPYFVGEIGGPLSANPSANPQEICFGESVTLSPGVGGGSGDYEYSWTSDPTGFTSTLENPVVIPEETTTYMLSAFDGFINANGQVTVTVIPLPVPNAGIDQTIPHGIYTFLEGSATIGSGDYQYYWTPVEKLEDAAVANPQTKNLYETTPFFLTVEDLQTGCEASEADQVVVEVTGGFLSTNPSSFPDSLFCIGETFTLYSNGGGGSGNYTYTWTSEPPLSLPSEQSFDLTLTDPGTYVFSCLIDDGYNVASGDVEVRVADAPVIDLGPPVQSYCMFDTIMLDAGNLGAEYLWSNGAISQSITVGTTGLGIIEQEFSVTVINQDGCNAEESVIVIFSYDECVGIDENGEKVFLQVFPNPSSGIVNINIAGVIGTLNVHVLNAMGNVLENHQFAPGDDRHIAEELDLSSYAKGIYFLKLEGDNIHHSVKMILK